MDSSEYVKPDLELVTKLTGFASIPPASKYNVQTQTSSPDDSWWTVWERMRYGESRKTLISEIQDVLQRISLEHSKYRTHGKDISHLPALIDSAVIGLRNLTEVKSYTQDQDLLQELMDEIRNLERHAQSLREAFEAKKQSDHEEKYLKLCRNDKALNQKIREAEQKLFEFEIQLKQLQERESQGQSKLDKSKGQSKEKPKDQSKETNVSELVKKSSEKTRKKVMQSSDQIAEFPESKKKRKTHSKNKRRYTNPSDFLDLLTAGSRDPIILNHTD